MLHKNIIVGGMNRCMETALPLSKRSHFANLQQWIGYVLAEPIPSDILPRKLISLINMIDVTINYFIHDW